MTYTFEEAHKLKIYYDKELIGKYFDDKRVYKIDEIEINPLENARNRYELRAKTSQNRIDISSSIVLFSEISEAAKRFGLLNPNDILNKSED
jgi:pyruvate/2-oxoglutarate dehydrogenase complex dihydrolipoamide acyltransferase (E2) component